MKVFERVPQIGMPHQSLDNKQVGAMLQMMGGKTVAESMRGIWLFNPGRTVPGICTNSPHGRHSKMAAFACCPFKKIILRFIFLEVLAQKVKQYRRQRHFSLFQPFTFLDIDLHATAVDVGQFDVDTLRYPCPGGINEHNDGAVLEIADNTQGLGNFILRKYQRECFGYFGRGQVFFCPLFVIDIGEEEPKGIVGVT